ncbi:MAG: VPLPA-CTERM sorting domain-containing protein [Pseudomonadota bacterium]
MSVIRFFAVALALMCTPAYAVTYTFNASSTLAFSDNPGFVNPPVGLGGPVSGSLRIDDTGGALTATLDLASALLGGFDPSQTIALTQNGDTLSGETPTGDGATGLIADTGTGTLNFVPGGTSLINITGLVREGEASVGHYMIFTIQVLLGLDLSGGAAGQTIFVTETFDVTDVTVTTDPVSPVPLPASAPLLLMGLGAVLALRRRSTRA